MLCLSGPDKNAGIRPRMLERAGIMQTRISFRDAGHSWKSWPVGTGVQGRGTAPRPLRGAGNDFEAIEKLRRLAFADQVESPQQLVLLASDDNMSPTL